MLYHFVRPLAKIALKTHFRKIYFSNADRIPWDKPVILAVNHPTSFVEPCMLAAFLPKSLYFLARGDLFKKPFYAKILESLHILPVFRLKDGGYGKIKQNYTTLTRCFDALNEQKTILIMAEGSCIQEKRLRPLRKGTARLAFGTYEKYPDLDIQIVPIGVNYTYPDEFRSEAMFDFGEPIAVRDYVETYQKNTNEGYRLLTEELEKCLRKRIVVINEEADEPLVENLLTLYRTDHPDELLPLLSDTEDRLQNEVRMAKQVHEMAPSVKQHLSKLTHTYFSQLKSHEITDDSLKRSAFANTSNLIILMTGFIPFLIGYIGNYIPVRYAQHVMETKVKDVEDKISVALVVAIAGYLLYYLGLVIFGFVINSMAFWILLAMLPVWGFFALVYREFYAKYKNAKKVSKLNPDLRVELQRMRGEILDKV